VMISYLTVKHNPSWV